MNSAKFSGARAIGWAWFCLRPWSCTLSLTGALLLTSGGAAAQSAAHIRLHYSAPADCPQASDVLRALNAQLAADFRTDTQLEVEAQVSKRGPAGYELFISYASDEGARDTRRMRGESCSVLRDAAALVLAVALSPAPPTAATAPVLPAPPSATSDATEHTQGSGGLLGGWMGLNSGLLPEPAPFAGIRAGWRFGLLQLSLGAQNFFVQSRERGAVTTRVHAFSVELGTCVVFGLGSAIGFGPCVSAEVGQITAQSRGQVSDTRAGTARSQALSLLGELQWHVAGPLTLALNGGLEWVERRPRFVVEGLGTVATPSTWAARVALGPLILW
jgi:hypothetical protein